jgi:glutathione synthase/RimK-type ligase-like ATP-grasp enzyme
MSTILMTLAEDPVRTTDDHFAVNFGVDEEDCFAFSRALQARGFEVYFVNWNDLERGEFRRMFHDNQKRFVMPLGIDDFDLVFVYKMEGFLRDEPRFLRMLKRLEEAPALVVNDPATIRHNMDKRYLWDLQRNGVRILPTYAIDETIHVRLASGEPFVVKPIKGERGGDVFLARSPADLDVIAGREGDFLAQGYEPAVRNGERSLVFLGHEFHHAVLKRPSASDPDEFRCNESLGGTVEVFDPSLEELAFATQVLAAYSALQLPIHFSRVDFIVAPDGPVLLEAELLNPSIYANYSGKGAVFSDSLADYFDGLLLAAQSSRVLPATLSA